MDFFTRLAERTQGLTPPVQPILSSRFAQAPTTSFFSDVLVEEQASAPERSTDSTYAPTHRSPERLASTLEPIAPDRIAKAHVSELRAETHTAKAIANEPFSPHEKAGLADSTAESNISRLGEDLHGRRFHQTTVRSLASLEQGTEQAAADSLLLPFDPLEHSNQTAGQHTQLPRAESNAAIEFLSHVPEGLLEQTAGGSKVFVRPRVERTARRTEDARPQPEASFDHREPARSFNDSAPPVIRVSIGRVEVRAILPPATAVERPSPARAKPNLSLDDYLNRGEKG